MSDGISSMYDDHDRYEALCARHGVTVLYAPHESYSHHEQWIKDFFVANSTKESWDVRKTRLAREREARDIVALEDQLTERKRRYYGGAT